MRDDERETSFPKQTFILRNLIGVGLILGGTVIIAGLVELWPAVTTLTGSSTAATTTTAQAGQPVNFLFGSFTLKLNADTSLLILAVLMGALGSFAGAATAFAEHLGVHDFKVNWAWWYALRIPTGIAIGVLVYVAARGGFLSSSGSTKDANPYGVAAMAGVGGLFSRQAMRRLEGLVGGKDMSRDGTAGSGAKKGSGPSTNG